MRPDKAELEKLFNLPLSKWDEGVPGRLLAALQDPAVDPEAADVAAELAGDPNVVDEKLAKALLEMARNEVLPEGLRARGAVELGPLLELAVINDSDDLPVPFEMIGEIQAALHALYQDESQPKLVRRRAFEGSIRGSCDWHVDAIRKAYASGDPEWRLTAVFGMHYCTGSDDGLTAFGKELMESIASDDPALKRQAVLAAGAMRHLPAWKPISELLRKGTPKELLLAAIEAAMEMKPKKSADFLVDLENSGDDEIDEAVEEALGSSAMFEEGFDDDDEQWQ